MSRTLNAVGKAVLGLAISAFFIWLTIRGIDLRQVWNSLAGANYLRFVAIYLPILVAIHFFRVIRWGLLLEPVGKPSFSKLNSAGAIGFMALVIMPFRLGEFARPLLIAESGRIRRSAAMASVVVERVVDGLAMAVVLIVALLFSHPRTRDAATLAWVRRGGMLVFLFFFAILVFLVIAYVHREAAVRFVNRMARPVSARLGEKLGGMLDAFIGGLKLVPDKRKVAVFVLLTLVYWGANGLGLAWLAPAFGLQLEVTAAFAVLGLLVVGVMIPAGPGMLGTFQGAIIIGMNLFFPDPAQEGAIQAFAWVVWAGQFGQQVLFGLYFMATGHVSFSSLMQAKPEADVEEPSPTRSSAPRSEPAEPGDVKMAGG